MDDDGIPSGPLPGASGLADILTEVEGISGPAKESKPSSNLPFTIGTSRSSESIELPFGTGALGSLRVNDSEAEEVESISSITTEITSTETNVVEQTVIDEPIPVADIQVDVAPVEVMQEVSMSPAVVIEETVPSSLPSSEPVVEEMNEMLLVSSPIEIALALDSGG